jgi:hypothetical protein
MNPECVQIQVECNDLVSCAINSQGMFVVLGSSCYTGDFKNAAERKLIPAKLPEGLA